MRDSFRRRSVLQMLAIALGSASAACTLTPVAYASGPASAPTPRAEGWLVKSYDQIEAPAAPKSAQSELAALKAIVPKRTSDDIARFQWWSAGGPVHRWNEIILDEMQEAFSTLPSAARHLALFQTALDDAVATARHYRKSGARGESAGVDAAMKNSAAPFSPSEFAAASAAAAGVLGYLFPARAAQLAAKADEAMQSRLLAGAELPQKSAAGRAIGKKIAASPLRAAKPMAPT